MLENKTPLEDKHQQGKELQYFLQQQYRKRKREIERERKSDLTYEVTLAPVVVIPESFIKSA